MRLHSLCHRVHLYEYGILSRTVLQSVCGSHRRKLFSSTEPHPLLKCELKSRAVLELKGSDTAKLLQGLVTNDVRIIEDKPGTALYSLMLNVKGRVMYDLFVHNVSCEDEPHRYLIDCDSGIINDLASFLTRYKIRKKVQINKMEKEFSVSAVIPEKIDDKITKTPKVDAKLPSMVYGDPRIEDFAYRLLHSSQDGELLSSDTSKANEAAYTERRYQWGLGEGIIDLPPGNCLPLESNIVFLNGASFDKGCYLGQELTARTKYTGVVRKRLVPLLFDRDPGEMTPGVTITTNGKKNAGKYRNHVGKYGLGLVRISEVKQTLYIPQSNGDIVEATVVLPHWWPQDCLDAIERNECAEMATR